MYRHGDVLVSKVSSIPEGAKKIQAENGRYVIAEGEATGHAHAIADSPNVEMFERDGVLYLRVLEAPEPFLHEEHNRTQTGEVPTLEPGTYTFPGQRVWHAGVARSVVD